LLGIGPHKIDGKVICILCVFVCVGYFCYGADEG
jgi:hypothetical protein